MLTYEDCLAFSELAPGAVAAIARHEHVPDILVLELGAHLCRTRTGREVIRSMIRDGIAEARRRGDEEEAAALERALEHFAAAAPGRSLPTDLTLEQRVRALGFDATAASWVRRRVEAYLGAMAGRFGVALGEIEERYPLELMAAETRCAACGETARCRRFLAGVAKDDRPDKFCPNAPLLSELGRPLA